VITRGRNAQVICIFGKRGEGKTTLAKSITLQTKHLVFDIIGEYQHLNRYIPSSDTLNEFHTVCQQVWKQGNLLFVVEEAEMVMPNSATPLRGCIGNIVHRGRHRGIGLLTVTRRPANLHKDVLSFADHIFIFKLTLKRDIDYVSHYIDIPKLRLMETPRYHFYYYNTRENTYKLMPPLQVGQK
jgi:DNA helicase HerA-like ATPase